MSFFTILDNSVERYFYGTRHSIGMRLPNGKVNQEQLRFIAAQEYHYYNSTTWWNAGKILNAASIEDQRRLFFPLLDELGRDLVDESGLPAHAELFLRYCEGIGLTRQAIARMPVLPAVYLAVSELHRIAAQRPTHEFIACSNLVAEKMRPPHYQKLLRAFAEHYTWVPQDALVFYEVHAELDLEHESLVRRYVGGKSEQDNVFATVLRSLGLTPK